jgi:hypothetical protein
MSDECQYTDCTVQGKDCWRCVPLGRFYSPPKKRKTGLAPRQAKTTGRRGSQFELDNHKANQDLLNGVTSRMTPNSGAGSIKGDE